MDAERHLPGQEPAAVADAVRRRRRGRRYDLNQFHSPKQFTGPFRCDLHPRWNRDGTKVCIDGGHDPQRQVYVVDVSDVARDRMARGRRRFHKRMNVGEAEEGWPQRGTKSTKMGKQSRREDQDRLTSLSFLLFVLFVPLCGHPAFICAEIRVVRVPLLRGYFPSRSNTRTASNHSTTAAAVLVADAMRRPPAPTPTPVGRPTSRPTGTPTPTARPAS